MKKWSNPYMMIHLNKRNQQPDYRNQNSLYLVTGYPPKARLASGGWLLVTGYFRKHWLLVAGIWLLLFLVGSSIHAQEKKVFDPWELGLFIEGKRVPPKDMVILIKMASVAPEGSSWFNFGNDTVWPEMNRATNGLIKIKLYGGGILGDEADTVRKLRMKQLHFVGVTNMGFTMMLPEMCVLELPFLFDWEPDLYYGGKHCEIDYIHEKLESSVAKLAKEKGLQYWGSLESCLDFITSKFPLKKVEDFGRLKSWLFRGDRIRPEINRVFNFKKTTSGELFNIAQMLSTGMADSSWGGWYVHIILQWWPHVGYVTDYPLYGYESATILADKRVFERLKAFGDKWGERYGLKDGRDLVGRLLEVGDRRFTELRFILRQDETKARQELIKRGAIQEVHFPEAELERLRQKVLPLYDKLADKLYPRWLLDEILKYRQEYRKLKAEGKLDEFHETGILPGGNQFDEWRTEWR